MALRLRSGAPEDGSVVIWRDFDDLIDLETTRFDGFDRAFRRQSQLGLWAARLAENRRLLARPRVPVDDREMASWLQHIANGAREPRLVRNTVKGIRHEYGVGRSACEGPEIVSIADRKVAVRDAAFSEVLACHVQ